MIQEKITGKKFNNKKEVFDLLFSLGYKCNFSMAKSHLKRYGSSLELAPHEFKINFAFQDTQKDQGSKTFLYAIYSIKYDIYGLVELPEEEYRNQNTNRWMAKMNMKTITKLLFS